MASLVNGLAAILNIRLPLLRIKVWQFQFFSTPHLFKGLFVGAPEWHGIPENQ